MGRRSRGSGRRRVAGPHRVSPDRVLRDELDRSPRFSARSTPPSRSLRGDAFAGKCQIRVPDAALLEARSRIGGKRSELSKAVTSLRDEIKLAVQNGYADLSAVSDALLSKDIDAYLQLPAHHILDEFQSTGALDQTGAVCAFGTCIGFADALNELRPQVRFEGKDESICTSWPR